MKYIFILALGITLVGCSEKKQVQNVQPPAVPVKISSVEVRDVPLFIEAIGVVKPAMTADVKPQVNGMIKEVHFTEGDWVEEGDLLYTLDHASYAIRVLEAEAGRDQNLAYWNNAQKKLDRYKSLHSKDLIAKVEWDELETQVALYAAMLKADEARLAAAKLDLEHCRILAPIAGLAGKSDLDVGNMAQGESLVTITQTDPLFVDFLITQQELQKVVKRSSLIKIYAAGKEDYLAKGKVTFMDHAINPKTGMVAVTAQLNKADKPLWPGQSVRVQLYFGKKEKALLIPMRAVKTNQQGPYIFYVKEDNTVEIRQVKLGLEDKGAIVVEEGLDEASKIVAEGQLRLFPGSKVEEVR